MFVNPSDFLMDKTKGESPFLEKFLLCSNAFRIVLWNGIIYIICFYIMRRYRSVPLTKDQHTGVQEHLLTYLF